MSMQGLNRQSAGRCRGCDKIKMAEAAVQKIQEDDAHAISIAKCLAPSEFAHSS